MQGIPMPFENEECLPQEVKNDHFGGLNLPGFLKSMKPDDIIIIALVVLLLVEAAGNDKILIALLVYLFISGLDGNILGF